MWVPALKGREATETGHRAYQHPQRSAQDYGQEIDRFSALVIYLSLAALERDATLWERFHTGDNLIFVREDFLQPGRSAVWEQLSRIGSKGIDQLAAALAAMVQQPPMKVSALDGVLRNLATFTSPTSIPATSLTSIPASAPAQRVAPKPKPQPQPQRVAPKPPPAPAQRVAPKPPASPPVPKPPPPVPKPTPAAPKPPVPSWLKKSGYRQPSDD